MDGYIVSTLSPHVWGLLGQLSFKGAILQIITQWKWFLSEVRKRNLCVCVLFIYLFMQHATFNILGILGGTPQYSSMHFFVHVFSQFQCSLYTSETWGLACCSPSPRISCKSWFSTCSIHFGIPSCRCLMLGMGQICGAGGGPVSFWSLLQQSAAATLGWKNDGNQPLCSASLQQQHGAAELGSISLVMLQGILCGDFNLSKDAWALNWETVWRRQKKQKVKGFCEMLRRHQGFSSAVCCHCHHCQDSLAFECFQKEA